MSGLLLMVAAWGISNLSVLYNVPTPVLSGSGEPAAELPRLADDPVIPRTERWQRWNGELVEPPFMPPPPSNVRQWNYWMMSQRSGTFTYTTFATGLSLVIFALFLVIADGSHIESSVFRTLGTNSLAAYILHDIASWIFDPIFPGKTSTPGLTALAFLLMFLVVWIPCRILEANKIYLRV